MVKETSKSNIKYEQTTNNNDKIKLENQDKIIDRAVNIFYLNSKNKPPLSSKVRFFAGLLGSTASSLVCSPLDLVKVRMMCSVFK